MPSTKAVQLATVAAKAVQLAAIAAHVREQPGTVGLYPVVAHGSSRPEAEYTINAVTTNAGQISDAPALTAAAVNPHTEASLEAGRLNGAADKEAGSAADDKSCADLV